MRKYWEKFKALVRTGLFHIMGATSINKLIAFLSSIVIVKIMSKYSYGLLSGAFNVFQIGILFNGFGISSATLFFASDKEDEETRRTTYKFAIRYGFLINVLISIGIFCYACWGNLGIEETRPYILCLAAMPLVYFFTDYFAIVLRSRKENKRYALLLNINSISYMILASVGSFFFGIPGTIAGRYLSYLITAVIGFIFTKKYIPFKKTQPADPERTKKIVKYAAFSGGVSALNTILYRIDIFLITLLVGDALPLATYKVAALVPENLNFVPASILVVFLPLFIEHSEDRAWVVKNARKLFISMAALCGFISLVMFAFAGIAIRLLWGEQYLDGVPVFRVLAISFFFLGTFRSTSTNILQALGKVKFNLIVSIVAAISNFILDYYFIKNYGIMGAATATLLVTVIASMLSFPYLMKQLSNKPQIKKDKTETVVK
ncbi:MAG: oligosaccharide flippase family protein [Clostridiales bacterium]|nr:oligosaccharide flippase family protein [Clostridiales bacterium]